MDRKKSIIASNFDVIEKTKQASDSSNDAAALNRMSISATMVQNVRLIWLHNSIDKNNEDWQQIIAQLRSIVNAVNTFTDADKCIDFLTDMHNEKTLMIISDTVCESIISLIHDVAQLHTIVIFCSRSKARYEQWTKNWFKIKGIFSDISLICKVFKEAAQQCEQNATSISFVNTNDDVSKKNLDELDPSFMYTQMLKEILLTIEFEEKHTKEFIDYCRNVFADNEGELVNVDKVDRTYHNQTPIWWYTRERFLYSMLNCALRLMDVNVIINMGFFIRDLHHHVEQLHNKQFLEYQSDQSFTLYRGQGMTKSDFNQLIKTKGGLISFNNFLSTTKDREVSFAYAESNQSNPDCVGVLFALTIDPSKSTTPFASINDASHFTEENEVLFSMHTVFRICDVIPLNEDRRLFQVDLTLTNDNDNDIRTLTNRMREEIFPDSSGWYRLAMLLLKMGQPHKAEQLYRTMLSQTNNEDEKGAIYHQIGWTKQDQEEYEDAIIFYEKALEIEQKRIPPDYDRLSMCYQQIGNVYNHVGECSKALSYYEIALDIRQKFLPSNHLDLAMSYNNIGTLHSQTGEHVKALPYFEKALAIRQKALPANHPSVGTCCMNIGHVYDATCEYSKAFSYYEKALQIVQKTLPSNHPHLAACYNSIGGSHEKMCEYSKALLYYDKAFRIQQRILPPSHPDLASSYNHIGKMYDAMGEYSKALLYYNTALGIRQQSLPSNRSDLADSYNNIGLVYYKMYDYSKALSFFEKAVEIEQQSFTLSQSHLFASYDNIAGVCDRIGQYAKQLSYCEKALQICQEIHPSNHPNFATCYNHIGNAYDNMEKYSKALEYYEKALQIYLETFPSNHCSLAALYNNFGLTYSNMYEYPKALAYYQKALEIYQRILRQNHPDLLTPYIGMAGLYFKMSDYSKALLHYEKALVIQQQVFSSDHPGLANLYNNIGAIYGETGEYSKALPLFERAVDILQQSLPENHPTLLVFRHNRDLVKNKL